MKNQRTEFKSTGIKEIPIEKRELLYDGMRKVVYLVGIALVFIFGAWYFSVKVARALGGAYQEKIYVAVLILIGIVAGGFFLVLRSLNGIKRRLGGEQ